MSDLAMRDDDLAPDPHLRRMLAHALDADVDARPAAATRAAILAAAHRAVAEPTRAERPAAATGLSAWLLHWLDRLLPRASMTWTAALATVALATFITLMWQGEPVPQAQPDGDPAALQGRAPVAEKAPASGMAPPAAPAPAESTAAPAAPSVAQVQPVEAERQARARSEAARAPSREEAAPPVPPQARSPAAVPAPVEQAAGSAGAASERADAPASPPAAGAAPAAPPPPAAVQAPRKAESRAATSPPASAAPAPAAAPAAPPAPAPAVAAAPAAPVPPPQAARAPDPVPLNRAEPAPGASSAVAGAAPQTKEFRREAPGDALHRAAAWQRWTQVRLAAAQGPALMLNRVQAEELTVLLSAVLPAADAPARDAALPTAVDGRLTLLQDGRPLGTLELGGSGVRWHAAGAAPVFAEPSPAALQALRAWLAQAEGRAR